MAQLLFLDTFSHDGGLSPQCDLVQFPTPVIVEEVRVLPLGARIQLPIESGMNMRLGATLPTRFQLEFFANDVTKPSASTFSSLGILPYDQNGQIHLNTGNRKIPTDGLVLRGLYSTITLAVYGILTPTSAEQLALSSTVKEDEEERVPIVSDHGGASLASATHQHRAQPHQRKRNEWTNSWPLSSPSAASTLSDNALDAGRTPVIRDRHHGHHSGRSGWTSVENGQRSNFENSNDKYNHHRSHFQAQGGSSRSRSPPKHRRSVTRSPPPPPPLPRGSTSSRRSLTPKSPHGNNGYNTSPAESNNKRKPPSVTDDQPVPLDDMSDISDGDIPEVDDVLDEKNEDNTNQSMTLVASVTELDGPMVVDEDPEERQQQQPIDIIPEDMEEISDEEADWSDDGDCFFLDPDSYRVDFGSDWVEPITIFKPDEHTLTELKYYCNNTFSKPQQIKSSSEESKNSSEKLVVKLNQMPLGSEWVETLETIDVSSLDSTQDLTSILKVGLSLSEALKQPVHTFKLRHLKSGLKFANLLLDSPHLSWELDDLLEIVNSLMEILSDPSIAAPLLVKCLMAIHRTLNQNATVLKMFRQQWTSTLVKIISQRDKLTTRLKVGLSALLQRINTTQSWYQLDSMEFQQSQVILKQLKSQLANESKPTLCFLSNEKCGVLPCLKKDLSNMDFMATLVKWCQAHIGEHSAEVIGGVQTIMEELIGSREGLILLASNPDSMNQIFSLFRKHQESYSSSSKTNYLAYCLHAFVKLDHLSYQVNFHGGDRRSLETNEVLSLTESLYGMTFSHTGREALVGILSRHNFLQPMLHLVKHSGEVDEENQQKKDMKKSAIRGYACELLLMTIRHADQVEYLSFFAEELIAIGKSDENSKLYEIVTWLNFLLGRQDLDWIKDNNRLNEMPKIRATEIDFFVGVVKQNIGNISPLSCELLMALRFLDKMICSSSKEKETNSTALLQSFSSELSEHTISILNKICGYHEQPHLHTATFAGFNGDLLTTVIRLLVRMLKSTLIFRIKCQDDEFRDTTAIPTLLKTYTLCTVVPENSASYSASFETCQHLLDILLAYTTVSVDANTGSSAPWQHMVTEVVKYVSSAPHTYLSGLKILSQLLPPLSDHPSVKVDDNDDEQALTLASQQKQRNMWSAQLFSLSQGLQSMITKLIPIRVGAVQMLLLQVCRQLSDLSAPVATIVAKAIAASIIKNEENEDYSTCLLLLPKLLAFPQLKAAFIAHLREPSQNELLAKQASTTHLSHLATVLLDPNITLDGTESWPDFDNSLVLLTSVIISTSFPPSLVASVIRKLSEVTTGLYLLKQCFLRNKQELSEILKRMHEISAADDFGTMCDSLLTLSKYVSPGDLREMLEDRLPDLSVTTTTKLQPVLDIMNSNDDKHEELEVNWPDPKPLLEQFKGRRGYTSKTSSSSSIGGEIEESNEGEEIEVDLSVIIDTALPNDLDIQQLVKQVCDEKSLESERQKKKAAKKSLLESKALANKNIISNFKAGGTVAIRGGRSVFNRGPGGQRSDMFRSRPPNTSRPPSLHVDDFLVLQSRGQQPTGPTGYNKQSLKAAQELFAEKEAKSKGSIVGYREATKEPVLDTFAPPPSIETRPPRGGSNNGASERTSKNYRNVSGNGHRTFNNRERYGANTGSSSSVNSSGGAGSGGNSQRWSSSPTREGGRQGGGGGRPFNHNRRNAKGDSRRGGKDRHKGKSRAGGGGGPRSGSIRSMPR